ncbi:TolC family outer membrane protein [Aquamicrobium defluvii]|uniref:Outer membrane protein n=1 Tax=Aquamicrobium defluvii TaxID=69279 RepID=A0A011TCU7_9HYPH|nr:TolC family outer membrane protein [Aquamicrobium defluvii]EXL01712.1 transporter [Aquamicrobium defluvii]EZQ12808.1 transporter [Halopseudomonas bauzanensis]TDR31474.1 outer membrane protein [Aquamicrobium defluvii]
MQSFSKTVFAALLITAAVFSPVTASAETITGALSKAYRNNSQLNSARAGVRVTDEDVAIAKSGYRPNVVGSASIDYTERRRHDTSVRLTSGSFGVQVNQMLFDGFQTKNTVAAAEARVRASQESLRNTEENILFSAAQAYMNVIHDRQVAALTKQNLEFLNEQTRAARSRLEVGEGTRTDVAQADAARSGAEAQLSAARAQALASAAQYRQLIGEEPGQLKAASPLSKLLPSSLDSAVAVAAKEHPAILATSHLVDAAAYGVKSAEGALLPSVTASAGVSRSYSNTSPSSLATSDGYSNSANIGATLSIPIYQGGRTSAQVRKSKEQLGQARIEVDVSRDQVRQAVTAAWTAYAAAQEAVVANRQLVSAAQLALNGVIEERNVGQRTTLEVLDSQRDVINAKINLASAERDVVLASYAILQAMGRLSVDRLGLQVAKYQPEEHYNAVKDKWFGLRTPDGR